MSNEVTYLGVEKEEINTKTKVKKDKAIKKDKFKTKKISLKLNRKIRDTKKTILNKKVITIILIVLLIYFIKPITFLKNKLEEKRNYYGVTSNESEFNISATKSGLAKSILYMTGFEYYSTCRKSMVLPADGFITYPYDWAHQGIDIACDEYADPIFAAANGTVIETGTDEKNGMYIIIKHNINNKDIYTYYSNLSQIKVNSGQYVYQNEPIASEGGNPDRPAKVMDKNGHHLHFEIRKSPQKNSGLDPHFFIVK